MASHSSREAAGRPLARAVSGEARRNWVRRSGRRRCIAGLLQLLPTWAKSVGSSRLNHDAGAFASDVPTNLSFPLGQTLSAAGEKNTDRMVGPGNTLAELEVPLHELHRL